MTTFVEFTPPQDGPFVFQAVLDGLAYTVTVPWGLFGARYYVNIYTSQGALVVSLPMIGSPPDYDISITAGYFATKLIWRVQNNQFEIV